MFIIMLTLLVIKLNIHIKSHQNDLESFFGSLSGKESCQLVKVTRGRPEVISRSASTLNLMNHRNHLFFFLHIGQLETNL